MIIHPPGGGLSSGKWRFGGWVCVKNLGDSLRAIEITATHGKFDLRRIGIQKRDAHPWRFAGFGAFDSLRHFRDNALRIKPMSHLIRTCTAMVLVPPSSCGVLDVRRTLALIAIPCALALLVIAAACAAPTPSNTSAIQTTAASTAIAQVTANAPTPTALPLYKDTPALSVAPTGAPTAQPPAPTSGQVPTLPKAPQLKYIATHKMPEGTHRPEIFVTDSGEIVLAVVQPEGARGVGQVKHKAYRFDARWNPIGQPFVLTRQTAEYGEPADHRAAIINNELVVVYQSLNLQLPAGAPPAGPAEQYAKDQSLLLARFSLSGQETYRAPIVANQTNRNEDNFPDHSLVWLGNRLVVSTGAGQRTKFRKVDLNGKILATHQLPQSPTLSTIGNSMSYDGKRLLFFSSGLQSGLSANELDSNLQIGASKSYLDSARRQTFPTGNLLYGDYIFVSYIAQDAKGSPSIETNPANAYLMILDKDLNLLADQKIGEKGFSHVHPTLARLGNRLFFAWSRRASVSGDRVAPQVYVEEYELASN